MAFIDVLHLTKGNFMITVKDLKGAVGITINLYTWNVWKKQGVLLKNRRKNKSIVGSCHGVKMYFIKEQKEEVILFTDKELLEKHLKK